MNLPKFRVMTRSCWLRMPWRDREKLQILAPKLQRRAIVPPKLERVVASALMFTFSFCFAYVFTCVIFFSLQFQNTLEFALKKSVIHRARLEAGFHEHNKLKTLHSNQETENANLILLRTGKNSIWTISHGMTWHCFNEIYWLGANR